MTQGPRDAIDPAQAFASGDEAWEETILTLNDLFWLRPERLQCAQDFALPLTTACQADYLMIVQPDANTPGRGTIIKGEVTTHEVDQPMTAVDADACNAYARCLLDARIGAELPIPPGQSGAFTMRQPIVYEWASASLFDPVRVSELISLYRDSVASKPEALSLSAEERLFYREEEQLLAYLEHHLGIITSEPER